MTPKPNRRDVIVTTAQRLFALQGYHATSMRQIAEGAKCTVAAIYCHFKSGKHELLLTVLEHHTPDLKAVLQGCESKRTLAETVRGIGKRVSSRRLDDLKRWCWIAAEFSLLTAEERTIVRKKLTEFHSGLVACIHSFFRNETEAQLAAWMIASAMFGYAQLSVLVDFDSVVGFTPEQLMTMNEQVLTGFFARANE